METVKCIQSMILDTTSVILEAIANVYVKECLAKYKYFLKTGKTHTNVVFLFDEFGIDNCKIELIENYPAESKAMLQKQRRTLHQEY